MTSIYALVDPRTGLVRYVGRTIDPDARMKLHLTSKRHNRDKRAWVEELAAAGLEPQMLVLEVCRDGDCDVREADWIARYRDQGIFNRPDFIRHHRRRPCPRTDRVIAVYLSEAEAALVARAAAAEDEAKPSRWARRMLLREARRVLGEEK